MPNPTIFDGNTNALRSPTLFDQSPVQDPAATPNVDALGGGELGRGVQYGLRSSKASAQAAVGGALDYAGLKGLASGFYQDSNATTQGAAPYAPDIGSLRDIHSGYDAAKFVASKIGSTVPLAGASVLGGAVGSLAGPAGAAAGAAAPFFPLGAGEAVQEHIKQDGTLDKPIEDIAPEALARGAVDAGLGAIAPARIGGAIGALEGKTFATSLAKNVAAETGINTAAGVGSYAADEALAGRSPTAEGLGDAAVGGAVGILPFAAAGHAVHGVKVTRPEAKPGEAPPPSPADGVPPAASPKDSPADWAQKVSAGGDAFTTADSTDHGKAAELMKFGLANAATSSPAELRAVRDEMLATGARYADLMSSDDRVSEATRARVAKAAADGKLMPEMNTLSDYAKALNAAAEQGDTTTKDQFTQAHQDIKDLGKEATEAVTAAKAASEPDSDVKFSMMDADEKAGLGDYVFRHLKDDFKDDPDALSLVKSVVHSLAKMDQFDGDNPPPAALARKLYHVLDDVVQDKAAFIKGLPSDVKDTLKALPERITAEATDPNSVIGRNLDKAPGLTAAGKVEVAKRFEQFLQGKIPEQHTQAAIDAFSQIFGSESAVRNLMDHYGSRYDKPSKAPMFEPTEEGTNLTEKDGPQATFHYAEPGNTRGFTSKDGAYQALDQLRSQDPDFAKNYSVHPLSAAADEHGGIDNMHKAVRGDLESRAKQDLAHPNEPVIGPDSSRFATRGERGKGRADFLAATEGMSPQKFLDQFHVIKSEDRETNDLVATDKDLQNMGTAVRAKGVKGKPELTADRRAGNFGVEMSNGKMLTLNAESVWKSMVGKGLKAQEGEGDTAYRSRLFKEGIASILARPDVKAVHGVDKPELLIDKESGLRRSDLSGKALTPEAEHSLEGVKTRLAGYADKMDALRERADQGDYDAVKQMGALKDKVAAEAKAAQKSGDRNTIEQYDRYSEKLSEDRLLGSDVLDKREGMTDIAKEAEEQQRKLEAAGKDPRNFEQDTGDKIGEAGKAPVTGPEGKGGAPKDLRAKVDAAAAADRAAKLDAQERSAKLDALVARVKSGDTKPVIEAAQRSTNIEGLRATLPRLASEARRAKGEAKKHLERTVGALSNRLNELITEKYAPSELGDRAGDSLLTDRHTTKVDSEGREAFAKSVLEGRKALDEISSRIPENDGWAQGAYGEVEATLRDAYTKASKGTLTVGDAVEAMFHVVDNMPFLSHLASAKEMSDAINKALRPLDPTTDAERAAMDAAIKQGLGNGVKTVIDALGTGSDRMRGSNSLDEKGFETIRVATLAAALTKEGAVGGLRTTHHEIFHAAIGRIVREYGIGSIKGLIDAAQQTHIRDRVLELAPTDTSREYYANNPEEMLVQAYAHYAMGELKLARDPQLKGLFENFKVVVQAIMRMLTGDPLLAEVFKAVKDGQLADRKPLSADEFAKGVGQRRNEGYLNYSKMKADAKAEVTPEAKQKAQDEFSRIAGDSIKQAWEDLHGASGKWDPKNDTVTFSKFAADPNSVAWHEALHALFSKLTDETSRGKLWKSLDRVAEGGLVRQQLERLLKDHPEALEQIRSDPQERLAYMFQFYKSGDLKLGPETKNIFNKIADFIRTITGTVSKYEQAGKYMDAIYEGKFSDPSLAAKVIEGMNNETLTDRAFRLAGPVGHAADLLMSSTTERLISTQLPAFKELADLFHRDPTREEGNKLGMLQERSRMAGKFMSPVYDILKGIKPDEGHLLVRALREGDLSNPKAQALADQFKKLWKYMDDAGVLRAVTDANGNVKGWEKMGQIKDYVPQIWNRDGIVKDPEAFEQAMVKVGVDAKDAAALRKAVMGPEDHDMVNMKTIGLTPFNRSINGREFKFTNDQLKALEPYLDMDPVSLMTTYVHQATHRAEYARSFGNDGSKIKDLIAKGRAQGATKDEMEMADKAVQAMTGTLGSGMDAKARRLMAGTIVYENLALLPLALLSSLVDPITQVVRSGDFGDARRAMVEGIRGLFNDMRGKEGEDRQMARTLGMISEENMLEKFGDLYNGMYMTKWLKNLNEGFFKYNGMESWNKSMRTSAMVAGERFMLKHTQNPNEHSERYLKELGVTKDDVKEIGNTGRIDKSSEQIQRALFKFVDDAVLRPNSAHRPIWGSDPHYAIIHHLKQYSFSFENVFRKRATHEAEYGNLMPMYALMAAVPTMDLVDTAQDVLFGLPAWHGATGLLRAVSRSGVLGTKTFGLDALADAASGGVPGQSFLGPAINHGIYAAQTAAGHHSAQQLLFRSLPAGAVLDKVT